MGTIPDPRTWNVGDLVAAADLNDEIRDMINWMVDPPRIKLGKSASQNNLTDQTVTKLTWNTEAFKVDITHSASSGDITVQTAGYYLVIANVEFSAENSVGQRRVDIFINGFTATQNVFASGNTTPAGNVLIRMSVAGYQRALVGDVFNVGAYQSSGLNTTDITTNSNFAAIWMES